MAKSFQRVERIGQEMQVILARLISQEIKDPRLGVVTITGVEVTRDLAYAKVYFVVRDEENQRDISLKILKQAAGFLRRRVADEITLRIVPELQFVYDASSEYGRKIDDILRHL